ncbi:MAG: phosphate starvation-inducible protein PhoH, partial [Bacteroidaceae bacterium]
MIERHILLDDIDLVSFYGVNNIHLQMLKALYPKLRIIARGNQMKVLGDEEEMCSFEENINKMIEHCAKYNSLNEEAILNIIKGRDTIKN